MNWYKTSQSIPIPAAPAQAQPQGGMSEQDIQVADKEVSGKMKKLRDFAVKWMLSNEMVVRYMANPTDEARVELVSSAMNEAVKALASELPGIGRFVGVLPIEGIMKKVPGMEKAAQGLSDFIFENLRVGFIPDEISNQSNLLKAWDLPDDIAGQFESKITELKDKDPKLAQNFIVIILRLKDDAALLGAQQALMNA